MRVPQLPMVKAVGAYDAASSRCVNSKIASLPLKTPVTLYSANRRRARKCCGGLQTGIAGFLRHKFISRRVSVYP